MPQLSLCVIAKDEAAVLPDLFRSVAGVVDEIVFVDTGSTDNTVPIARAVGAKVVHHEWKDDFADARNRALEASTGDWILVLDCDERLAPGAGKVVRQAVEGGGFDLGMLPLYNATRSDASPEEILSGAACNEAPTLLPRLLRRDPDLRWHGRVHESVTDWVTTGNKRIQKIEAPILHLGNAEDIVEAKDKLNRNWGLLKRRCAEEPDNPVMWSHLARVSIRAQRPEEAWQAALKGWEVLQASVEDGNNSHSVEPLVTVLAFLALQRGEEDAAFQVLQQARNWSISHPNLALLEGVFWETMANRDPQSAARSLENAAQFFKRALEMGDQVWTEECMPGATSWASSTRLGTVRLLQDDWENAKACFVQALQQKGDHIEAALGLVESLVGMGAPEKALALVERVLESDSGDAWILAAFAARNMGQVQDCALFLEQADRVKDSGLIAPHRRAYFQLLSADLQQKAV